MMKIVTPDELEKLAAEKSNQSLKVILFDWDHTLIGFDYSDIKFEEEKPQRLFGGQKTLELLFKLKQAGFSLAIVSKKSKEHTNETFSENEPLRKKLDGRYEKINHWIGRTKVSGKIMNLSKTFRELFDFFVYENCEDDKQKMLQSAKQYYGKNNQSSTFVFIDDKAKFCETAKELGMIAIHSKTNSYDNSALTNDKLLLQAIETAAKLTGKYNELPEDFQFYLSDLKKQAKSNKTKHTLFFGTYSRTSTKQHWDENLAQHPDKKAKLCNAWLKTIDNQQLETTTSKDNLIDFNKLPKGLQDFFANRQYKTEVQQIFPDFCKNNPTKCWEWYVNVEEKQKIYQEWQQLIKKQTNTTDRFDESTPLLSTQTQETNQYPNWLSCCLGYK